MPQIGPSVPLWTFCGLLLVMAFKHFVADFLFQTSWIAHGKERVTGWFAPLAIHVLGHAALTLLIALAIAPRLWWLAPADLVVHAAIDRGKSVTGHWGRWDVKQGQFWWLMGFDQFLHQVTNIALAAAFFVF
ncbi:DUF3307 domain-containing protein [Methylocapsa sp. S129]|uniref:DUF3307 domain-containing protein n=1 Tax=Methylocapsa sp. S129 TaxID=1641869 RepID=UPI001FEF29BC|nr:DUF3307 domain-containing protein [Methylocapsa sp. S129]